MGVLFSQTACQGANCEGAGHVERPSRHKVNSHINLHSHSSRSVRSVARERRWVPETMGFLGLTGLTGNQGRKEIALIVTVQPIIEGAQLAPASVRMLPA